VTGAAATAELLADGGAAASGTDFFRSRRFLAAERATHTLRISIDRDDAAGALVAPVIGREIPGSDRRDAISPYGYPGFKLAADSGAPGAGVDPIDPASIDFSPTGLVSLFVRHRLGSEPPLSGSTARNTVFIADPRERRKSRASDRQQIRRNEREGYRVEIVSGPQSATVQRAGFLTAYLETMKRAGAEDRYLYDAAYFDEILTFEGSRLALAIAPSGAVSAASIVVRSDGMLHYHLSGTANPHLRDSPMKNVVSGLVDLAVDEGLPLNLGGGISAGDRLEEFKRGFANRSERLRTSEIICDADAYATLGEGRAPNGYFPAYRASG